MGKNAGQQRLSQWIQSRDIDRLREFYRRIQPQILKRLNAQGFRLTEDTLSVRVDYNRNELFLGALLDHGDEGRFMTWAGTRASPSARPFAPASYGMVLRENRELLVTIGSVVGILIMAIWLLPLLASRRKDANA